MRQDLSDVQDYGYVLGALMQRPTLLENADYPLDREDFTDRFHRILYVAIHNLYVTGHVGVYNGALIDAYLSTKDAEYNIFLSNDGINYIDGLLSITEDYNFEYHYHRIKKFSLLKHYEDLGYDTLRIYNPQNRKDGIYSESTDDFDSLSEASIVDFIEEKFVIDAKIKYCCESLKDEHQAGDGLQALVDSYIEEPDYGYPLTSIALTTLSRGARKGTFLLRSALTGTGKTRQSIMDACNFAVPYVYDLEKKKFVYTGHCVPTLYIGVENSVKDSQIIALSAVSKVSTDHIKYGRYEPGEKARIDKAIKYIEESPLYLTYCDDYNITDIENIIKSHYKTNGVEICLFDYLQTSLRLLNEIRSQGMSGMQEYQVLRVFATRLKALAERLNICIISATQVNDNINERKYKDQSCIEGSKSIANKVDLGLICTKPTPAERAKLEKITHNQFNCPEINLLQWVYKVRDGRYSRIIICSHLDLGTMQIKDCFITDYDFQLIDVELDDVQVVKDVIDEHSVFIPDIDDVDLEPEEDEKPKKVNFDF